MSDIMSSFQYLVKKEFPWMNLSLDENGSYKNRDTALAFVFYSKGWLNGERG